MKKIVLFLVGVLLSAVAESCHEDNTQPNPCDGVVPTSADFTMKELILDTLKPEADTIFTDNTVEFSAKYDADEYEWKLSGDDRTWTTKSFKLQFYKFIGNVDVRLIVKRKTVNKQCTPDDDGIDTVTRRLTVVRIPAIAGTYRGVNVENPQDTFTVMIRDNRRDWYEIVNVNKGCYDTTSASQFYLTIGNKYIVFSCFSSSNMRPTCWDPRGTAQLYPGNNHVVISYSVTDPTNPKWDVLKRKFFTFKGVRL